MSTYTPPVTWATATDLDAADVNSNLQALQDNINLQKSSAADIADGSITSDRVLRPKLVPVSDQVTSVYYQTGSIHHIRKPAVFWQGQDPLSNVPYASTGYVTNAGSNNTDTTAFKPIPGTWISYHADELPIAVIVRIIGEIVVPYDAEATQHLDNRFHVRHVDSSSTVVDFLGSTCRIQEQAKNTPILDKRPYSTSIVIKSADLSQGWNHVGLVHGWESNFGLLCGMEMTVEVIY